MSDPYPGRGPDASPPAFARRSKLGPDRPAVTVPDHQLLHQIGRGSYGEVWLARNVMGSLRAVKLVHREDFEHARPFEREFAGLQRYEPISRSHGHLVNILQIGQHDTFRCFYYVMELADDGAPQNGHSPVNRHYRPRTLASELQTRGRLPLDECLAIGLALASGLSHLHKHALVHRDLKPSNIIFVRGQPKIADIGLVSEFGESRSLVGTEGFFPPQGPGQPQADLYALGKVLYEASTGLDRLQFPKMPAEWLTDPQHSELVEFNEVVLKACENDPLQRYSSAEEMLADLSLLQVGKSVRQLRRLEKRLRWARRFGAIWLAAAVMAGVAYQFAQRQARVEKEARQRVQRAESEARTQLSQARLAEASALRRTGEAGQRFAALEAISAAARVQSSLPLRNEAIQALALVDVRIDRRLPLTGISHAEPAIDPQGQRYLCGQPDGSLAVRRVADDQELVRLPGAGAPPDWIPGFSPDGRFLAVRPTYDSLVVWDLERRVVVFEAPPQREEVYLQFTPDSARFLWSAGLQPLRLCELPTGIIRQQWRMSIPVWRFACDPTARQVALAFQETNLVEILDLQTSRIVHRIPQPSTVQGLQWSRHRALLATGCHDRKIHLWDPETGLELRVLAGHQDVPAALDFHPTLDILASSSWDGTTRLWETQTGDQLVVLQEAGDNLMFSKDGTTLAFGEYSDAHVLICRLAGEPICRTLQAPETGPEIWFEDFAFGRDGEVMICPAREGVLVLDSTSGRRLVTIPAEGTYSAWMERDGEHVLTTGERGVLRWSLQPAAASPDWAVNEPTRLDAEGAGVGRGCQGGGTLAWVHGDHVHTKDENGAEHELRADFPLEHVKLSQSGRWLAASGWRSDSVQIWQLSQLHRTWVVPCHGRARVEFSPDETVLVMGGSDEYLIWDLTAAKPRQRLGRFQTSGGYGKLAFSPGGQLLAVAQTRSTVALYEFPTLREVAAFGTPHNSGIAALQFDPSGRQLAAAGALKQIHLWDIPRMRQELARLGLEW